MKQQTTEKGEGRVRRWNYRHLAVIFCLFTLLFALSMTVFTVFAVEEGNTYYFDSEASDGGTGTKARPFNSLKSIEGLDLAPGSKIYIKNGSVFKEQLRLVGINGTKEQPITVTSYGDGNNIPRIDGCDTTGEGVIYIQNCNWLTVSDLEICDTATYEADRRGVLIYGESNGDEVKVFSGITLDGLYVHHIKGINGDDADASSRRTGAIQAWCSGNARFDGFAITDCYVTDVDGMGIAIWRDSDDSDIVSPYSDRFANLAHTNVSVSYNDLSYVGKSAIYVSNLMNGVIEHNVARNTAIAALSDATIVTDHVYGTLIQYNEGYLNSSAAQEVDGNIGDGSMLHAASESRETVWQYNYSHDNNLGLFTNSGASSRDKTTVRFNLSVNDYGRSGIIAMDCTTPNLEIYNNTIVCGSKTSPVILKSYNGGGFSFYNNLIYNTSSFASISIDDASLSNNIVYNVDGASIEGLDSFKALNTNGGYNDPLFVGEMGANVKARSGAETAKAFQVDKSSEALTLGKTSTGVETDYFGNSYSASVGFYSGNGTDDGSIDYPLNADDYREYQYSDIEIIRNIPYATVTTYKGGSKTLHLDIYSAKDCTDRNRPLLVMIHGGGLTVSSAKEQSYAIKISKLMAQKGYIVASIDYRTRESSDMKVEGGKAAALDDATADANTAINWLRSNSGVYGFNPDYIFIAGGSAGGAISVCYAFAEDSRGFDKSGVVAVANLWGGPRDIFDENYDSDFSQDDNFPTIFIHGTGDTTMEYTHSLTTCQKMVEKGILASWNPIAGAEHSLIGTDDTYEMTVGLISEFFADRLAEKITAEGGYTQPPVPEEGDKQSVILPSSTKDIIYPNADTYLYSNSAGKYANYSTETSLFVYDSSNKSYLRSTIMRFDTIPNSEGSYLNKTILRFNVTDTTGVSADNPMYLDVYGLTDNYWFVEELTWTNTPDYSEKVYLGTVLVSGEGEYTVDLTNYVYGIQQAGGRTVSLLLDSEEAPDAAKRIEIASYENIRKAPYLECSYSENEVLVHNLAVQVNGPGKADVSEATVVDGSSLIVNLTPDPGYIASHIDIDTLILGVEAELKDNQVIISNIVADTLLKIYFTSDDSVVVATDSTTVQYGSATSAVVNSTDSSDPTNINPLFLCTKGSVDGGNNNTNRIVWLKFDISDCDFTNEKIFFEIYCYKNVEFSGNTMPVDVYATTYADWSSDSFAWNDQPFADGLQYGSSEYEAKYGATKIGSFTVNSASKWYTVDITEYARALRVSGLTTFSLMLVDSDYKNTSPIARFVSTHGTASIDGVSLAPRLTTERSSSTGSSERIDLDVSVTGASNGSASGYTNVISGGAVVLEIEPKDGYDARLTVDGVEHSIYDGKACIFGADESTEILITFAKEYKVTVECDSNTSADKNIITLCKGDTVTILFASEVGYKPEVRINGHLQTLVDNSLTVTVIQDLTITVEGVKIID